MNAPAEVTDVRPFHHVSEDTIWGDATLRRNACYDAIKQALADRQINALITRSANGLYPAWVKVEAWMPETNVTVAPTNPRLRTTLEVRFDVKPYREFPITASAITRFGRRSVAIADRPHFTTADAVEWALYTVAMAPKPKSAQFSDFAANVFLAIIPGANTRYANRVLRPFTSPNFVTLSKALVLAGLICIGTGIGIHDNAGSGISGPAMLAFAAGGLALLGALTISRRRKVVVSVISRPAIPPRYLLRVDSWHAVIPNLGPPVDEVRQRLVKKLGTFTPSGIATATEQYGFRSPNGYDERERLVITKGQGVAHLHLYRFGVDIFVGWDSYINWAQWAETSPVSTRISRGGVTEYRSLEPALYVPNEYDLIDLNSLIEVMHRSVTGVLKAMMEENKIDQEVDFSIIRGDRDLILDKDRYDQRRKQAGDGGSEPTARRRWRIT